jgi:anti-sigma B factor antagonist
MRIDLDVAERAGWQVVSGAGEIDITTAPQLRDQLSELIDGGSTRIVIDLNRVGFLDSTALGVMVGAHKRLREAGHGLVLACTQPSILRVLDVTGLSSVFALHDSVDAAVTT